MQTLREHTKLSYPSLQKLYLSPSPATIFFIRNIGSTMPSVFIIHFLPVSSSAAKDILMAKKPKKKKKKLLTLVRKFARAIPSDERLFIVWSHVGNQFYNCAVSTTDF